MFSKFAAVIVMLLVGLIPVSASADTTRILLVPTALDHPWETHMYGKGCEILAECLNQTLGVEAVVSPDVDWPSDRTLFENVDALVYYSRAAADIVLAPEREEFFRTLLGNGVGYAAVHWSTGSIDAKNGPAYIDALGGWFHFDHAGLKTEKQTLIPLSAKHPVLRGWKPFEIFDEFYLNLKFHPDTLPLVKVQVDGVDQVVAWGLERKDGGRSFGTTLGHFHNNFKIPAFRQLLVQGILWSAKADIPPEGVTVEASAEKLEIGPPPVGPGN